MMLAPRTWSTLSALFLGFVGGALFMALVNGPTVVHVSQVQTPAMAPVEPVVHASTVPTQPFAQPPSVWGLESATSVSSALSLSQTQVAPGQQIVVAASIALSLPRDAWIGVIPSHVAHGDEAVNDQHDLSYQYLDGRKQGVFVFTAPSTPGSYDLRLHSTDANGVELASVTFQVVGFL